MHDCCWNVHAAALHLQCHQNHFGGLYIVNDLSLQARQLAVASDQDVIFHPSGGIIQCLHRLTGQNLGTFRGHLDTVNCCCYNSYQQELYSGGNDGNIIVWAAAAPLEAVEGLDSKDDQDAWSD